jgi:hypothetical protein
MRSPFLIAALSLFLLGIPPAVQADDPPEETPPPEQLAREGVEKLMRALNALIEMIPQFEMPQLNEDGDIIIRRKHDNAPAEPEGEEGEEDDQTST